MFDNRQTKAEIIAAAAIQNDKLVMAYIDINDFRKENERLRAALWQIENDDDVCPAAHALAHRALNP
jgi:hypothetical protein